MNKRIVLWGVVIVIAVVAAATLVSYGIRTIAPEIATYEKKVSNDSFLGAAFGLEDARQKSRDAYRLSNIKQIQTALELYYADQGSYPAVAEPTVLAGCLTKIGFTTNCPATNSREQLMYMSQIPENIEPGGTPYTYTSTNATGEVCTKAPCEGFKLTFAFEGKTGRLEAGEHTATHMPYPNDLR
jgi:type II secretory pathway pseudopilin PulG